MIIKRYTLATGFIQALLLMVCAQALAEEWPDIQVPPNTRVTVVADNLIMNGSAMRTWEISISTNITKAQAFYEKEWAKPLVESLPGYDISETDDWLIISRLSKEYFISVQLAPSGKQSTQGYFAIKKLPQKNEKFVLGKGFELPRGSSILNDISAKDGPKKSRTIVAVNDGSVPDNAKFFRTEYQQHGWKELKKGLGENNFSREALLFDKRGAELNIALVNDANKTFIIAVTVDN